jgi:hypothetical protein
MVQRFNLTVPDDRMRADIDAHLLIEGVTLNFELKSTTSGSVSTVRDFGPDHIKKWRDGLHWIFGFYNRDGTRLDHCVYASPLDMEPWIAEKERYVLPDVMLASSAPKLIGRGDVVAILGERNVYSQADARWLMKKQWNVQQYREYQDLPTGYSLERMTEILQERCRYVILRGATLNNPHIEASFFANFEHITDEPAKRLRELVRGYMSNASATDLATQ